MCNVYVCYVIFFNNLRTHTQVPHTFVRTAHISSSKQPDYVSNYVFRRASVAIAIIWTVRGSRGLPARCVINTTLIIIIIVNYYWQLISPYAVCRSSSAYCCVCRLTFHILTAWVMGDRRYEAVCVLINAVRCENRLIALIHKHHT